MKLRLGIVTALFVSLLPGADPYCGGYTPAMRREWADRLTRDRDFRQFSLHRRSVAKLSRPLAVNNFVDTFIAAKMDSDGVAPAPPTTDAEFLRRVSLDLTGRIPTPEKVDQFIASNNPNKRNELIEDLLGSDAYLDRWSLYFRDKFQLTTRYYQFISTEGRNRFDQFIRDFLLKDRPYNQVAQEIISAEGAAHEYGPVNYITRGYQNGDPIQDTYDTLTDRTTVRFLGFKTECVSCHDGRRAPWA